MKRKRQMRGRHVEINIENYGNDMTPQELARRISDLLNGSTAPPS